MGADMTIFWRGVRPYTFKKAVLAATERAETSSCIRNVMPMEGLRP